jgi:uroporphyrinogen decarboxylase
MVEGGGSKTFQEVKTWIFKWPEESKTLLMRIADVCADFVIGQVRAGAQVCPSYPPNSISILIAHAPS